MTQAEGLDDITHPFGEDTDTYPNEFNLANRFWAFSQVFELYVTESVSERWSESEWEGVIGAIMNNDTTTTTDDVFGRVWEYFVREGSDADRRHAGVQFTIGSTTFDRIRIRLYDHADVPDPCPSEYGYVCDQYSFYDGRTNVITVNASAPVMSIDEILGLGIAHELQHLCYEVSVASGYESIDETMSTLAEYFVDSWRPHFYDLSYDAGVVRDQRCEPWIRYDTEKAWIVYLYEAFRGDAQDPADDLVYRWINSDAPVGAARLSLEALAALVWQQSDYAWLGGADSRERFARLGANYLAAKFCNAPALGSHGEFGSGGMNTVRDLALFLKNCDFYGSATPMTPVDCPSNLDPGLTGIDSLYASEHLACWSVRVLVPDYELTDGHDQVWATVDGLYTDGDDGRAMPEPDGSKDYIDVQNTGTDYVIFRAGSYYDDGRQHNLHLRLRGTMGAQVSPPFVWQYPITPVGWVIGYGTHEDTLQLHPEAIQFIEPLAFTPEVVSTDTTEVEFVVSDFGRSVKVAVLAVGAMPYGENTLDGANWLVYEYDYGVSTPDIGAFSRVNGTLHAQPDTAAAGCPQGDGDEVVITVALDPDFYDGPIARSAFGVTAPDSAIVFATVEADSDATLIDGKYRTTITLSRFGSCGSGPLTVLLNSGVLGAVDIDMRSVDIETVHFPGIVQGSDLARFGFSYKSPPKPYDSCADFRFAGQVNISDFAFFGTHYNHSSGGGNPSMVATAMTDATLRLDLAEENPLVGERRLYATVSAENAEPFRALVVSLRSDHPRLRFISWEPDATYPTTTMGAEVARDGVRQAFVGVIGDGKPLAPVVEFGRVEFEVLGEEPLVLSPEDLNFIIADLEVVGGGVRAFSPIRLEKNEVKPAYRFELAQNVPNPFNPSTTIAYSLAGDADVMLAIYDVKGSRVKTLASGHETTGIHRVPWDGTNDRGVRVSSGVYFYRLIAGSFRDTKKMVLLR